MEIVYFNEQEKYSFPPCIATIGAFDGFHLGHFSLFNMLEENKNSLNKMVITFEKHPDYTLSKRNYEGNLYSFNQKIAYFEKQKIDFLVVLNEAILKKSYFSFNKIMADVLNIKRIVVGEDFKYGYKGEGNISTLQDYFEVISCKLLSNNEHKLSSNDVRNALKKGDLLSVRSILGINYIVEGVVEKGAGLGKKLGFPTANINAEEAFLMLEGVYACYVYVDDKRYLAVVNVGKNPTINTQIFPRIEAFLLGFNGSLYHKNIKVEFLEFIRSEKKFAIVDELIAEIHDNAEYVKNKYQ